MSILIILEHDKTDSRVDPAFAFQGFDFAPMATPAASKLPKKPLGTFRCDPRSLRVRDIALRVQVPSNHILF